MVLWPHPFIPKASSKLKQQRETFYRCPMFLVKAAARYWLFLRVSSCFCRLQQISPVVTCLIQWSNNEEYLIVVPCSLKKLSPVEECFSKFLNDSCTALRPCNTQYFVTNGHHVLRGWRTVKESEVHWSNDSGATY